MELNERSGLPSDSQEASGLQTPNVDETTSLINGGVGGGATTFSSQDPEASDSFIQIVRRKWLSFYNELDSNTRTNFYITVFFTFITGLSGIFFTSLFFVIVASYLAHRLFENQILSRGSNELEKTTAYSFVGKGVKGTLIRVVLSIILGFMVIGIPVTLVTSTNPAWFQEISVTGQELGSHGEIVDSKFYIRQGISNARYVIQSPKSTVLQTTSRMLMKKHGYMQSALPDDQFELPNVVFEDGTSVLPLVGEMLVALSKIPTWLVLYCGIMTAFLTNAFTNEFVKMRIIENEALSRENSTFRSVVASGMAVALGMTIIENFILRRDKGAILGSLFFWLDAILQMSIAGIIAMNLYHNSGKSMTSERSYRYTDEKKIVLLEPVLYRGLMNFAPILLGIAVLKIAFPELGALLQNSIGKVEDCTFVLPLLVIGLAVFAFELCLAIYVVKKAMRRFDETTAEPVPEISSV